MCMYCSNHEWCTRYFKKVQNRCSCGDIKEVVVKARPQSYAEFALLMDYLNGEIAIRLNDTKHARHKIEKVCKVCGDKFKTYDETKEYCSSQCQNQALKATRVYECKQCGKKFTPKTANELYCSDECRKVAIKMNKLRREQNQRKQAVMLEFRGGIAC